MKYLKKIRFNRYLQVSVLLLIIVIIASVMNLKTANAGSKTVSVTTGNYTNSNYLETLAVNSIAMGQTDRGMDEYQQAYNISGNVDVLLEKAIYAKSVGDVSDYKVTKKDILKYANPQQLMRFKSLDKYSDLFKALKVRNYVSLGLPQKHHAFIVLGLELNSDGTMKDELINRLDVAQQAMYTYPDTKIIVSGGNEKNNITEAHEMYNYLVMNGISPDRIIEENQSSNTYDNCMFSMRKLIQENIESATVISSHYHLKRAIPIFELENDLLARKYNLKKIKFTNAACSQGQQDKMDYFRLAKDLINVDHKMQREINI